MPVLIQVQNRFQILASWDAKSDFTKWIHKPTKVVLSVVVVGFIDSDIMYTEINCDNTTMYTQKFTADQEKIADSLSVNC